LSFVLLGIVDAGRFPLKESESRPERANIQLKNPSLHPAHDRLDFNDGSQ
jgi:hypothetical protein